MDGTAQLLLGVPLALASGFAYGYLSWAYAELISLFTRWILLRARRPSPGTVASLQGAFAILAWMAFALAPAAAVIFAGPGNRRIRFLILLGAYAGVLAGYRWFFRWRPKGLDAWLSRTAARLPLGFAD
ncbi:MAG: hypothetical protein K2X35_14845 [Bryobacteraceae bacterium]|nr:hypothetical protein [Bryobacteraceae bacterium]